MSGLDHMLAVIEANGTELWLRTGQHIMLTGVSTLIAIVLGIPLGVFAAKRAWAERPLLAGIGILQTVPSLAMLALLLAMLQQIGALPAIIALTLYALLPIVRNTVTGLRGIAPEILEAARGVGMTTVQRLRLVELPLALPVLVAGVRTAAVVGVGIATLSAFIGDPLSTSGDGGGRVDRRLSMGHRGPPAHAGPGAGVGGVGCHGAAGAHSHRRRRRLLVGDERRRTANAPARRSR